MVFVMIQEYLKETVQNTGATKWRGQENGVHIDQDEPSTSSGNSNGKF